jgi:hypothetical protein
MSGHQRLLKMAPDQRKGELSQAAKLTPESLPSWLCGFDPRRPLRLVPWSGVVSAPSGRSDSGVDGTFMAHPPTSVAHSWHASVHGPSNAIGRRLLQISAPSLCKVLQNVWRRSGLARRGGRRIRWSRVVLHPLEAERAAGPRPLLHQDGMLCAVECCLEFLAIRSA